MNRGMNLPAIQKIMNEFEKESSMMDMKEEMMSDAIDDVMDDEVEEEEEEGDKILKQVLDEVGVDLSQQVRHVAQTMPCTTDTNHVANGCTIGTASRSSGRKPAAGCVGRVCGTTSGTIRRGQGVGRWCCSVR